MLYFHYCQTYLDKVSSDSTLDSFIRRKIDGLKKRTSLDLSQGRNMLQYGNVYVLQTKEPRDTRTIIQKDIVNLDGNSIEVYFIQDTIDYSRGIQSLNVYKQITNRKWAENNPIPEFEKQEFIVEREKYNGENTKKNRIEAPLHLSTWHSESKLKIPQDIFESKEWVEFALSNSLTNSMQKEDLKLFRIALQKMLEDNSEYKQVLSQGENTTIIELIFEDVAILYSKIEQISEKPIFFLHVGTNIKSQGQSWEKEKAKIEREYKTYNLIEEIRKDAFRAYPSWVLKNNNLWTAIQKNSETGNLALLQEQIEYLQQFKFPSYIKGRAGSGKSTMLYYIFANCYYLKCAGEIQGDIIFLTENEKLLEHSQKSIIDLLQCNPEFELSLEDVANAEQYFKSFKEFLLLLIPEEDTHLFEREKYLDFSKFKQLYENSKEPKKNKYSAEWVWFVITTYVYGFDLDFQITSDNYDEKMPNKAKDILTKEELRNMERDILPFYERHINNEYWDKIKIIRHLTKSVNINSSFEAIFCDEAQDFSRVELKFILERSTYIQYDLRNVEQIPIVFAADALQTINPTGFRSDSIQPMFHEALESLFFNIDKTTFSNYNPKYNYRSSKSIVNVANAVLNFRKMALGEEAEDPQIAKIQEPGKDFNLNIFLNSEFVQENDTLQKKLNYKTIIIPTTTDEKENYIDNYSYLKSQKEYVKTAIEAKGIDYNQVIIHGFGKYYMDIFGENELSMNIQNTNKHALKFFFNKLYVAITRAKSEAIIIDSANSIKGFWKPLLNLYSTNDTWITQAEVSSEEILRCIEFGVSDFSGIQNATPEMAFENALKDKERAEIDNNPGLMRLAANQFTKIRTDEAKKQYYLCLAAMYEMEENWEKAAENYLNKFVGENGLEKTADVYWKGAMFEELKKLNGTVKNKKQQIRVIIAKLFIENEIDHTEIKCLYEERATLRKMVQNIKWRNKLLSKIQTTIRNIFDDDKLKDLTDTLEEITLIHEKDIWEFIAIKNYEFKRYEHAIKAFSKSGNIDNEIYVQAQLALAKRKNDICEWILALYELKRYQPLKTQELGNQIIEIYVQNKEHIINSNNEYAILYVYFSYLLNYPNDSETIELGKLSEQKIENKVELIGQYQSLLETQKLAPSIESYVIQRWAKNAFSAGWELDYINQEYQIIAVSKHLNYITKEDIQNISLLPEKIQQELPKHIHNITLKNFRQFKDTKIENLGLFNLVVGDNNIGKTSFLEALLFTPNKEEYLKRLAFAYIERGNILPKNNKSDDNDSYYNLKHDFYLDFQNAEKDSDKMAFIIKEKWNYWHYKIGETTQKDVLGLTFTENELAILDKIHYLDAIQQPYMPYGKGFGKDLAEIYQREIEGNPDTEVLDEFIKNLGLFIPNIKRIIANSKEGTIRITDDKKQQHLSQYGEGANKLFRILILLTLHKGKRLMIDEIDAGIHYSRFKDFWKIILTIAMQDKNKTQIFATTHNEECIEYFTEVLKELGEEYQKESRVVQMTMIKDEIDVYSYQFAGFYLAYQNGVEMRGGKLR